ncbi:MAG TPA: hypothetical protein VNO14_05935 [Blastocatellia bacterium]|nr:hypothetical protein [Blastocatellia bacterium]
MSVRLKLFVWPGTGCTLVRPFHSPPSLSVNRHAVRVEPEPPEAGCRD